MSVAVESLLALPFAVGYLIALDVLGNDHFVGLGAGHTALMVLSGPVTANAGGIGPDAASRLRRMRSCTTAVPSSTHRGSRPED